MRLADALRIGPPVVLDGGLATQLEFQGQELDSELWSAQLLHDDPDAIIQAHMAYFAAGAQVATTASYQASLGGFARGGIERSEAEQLIRRSVRLAEQARARFEDDQDRWIAGSVGPYGASLADGSEYRGDYDLTINQLRTWHRPRIALLAEAGVDILAVETIPCLAEVEALIAEIDGSGQPSWLSITCAGDRTRAGEPAAEAFSLAHDVEEIIAVGVNCIDPADAYPLIRSASESSGKPVVVYPNSGERWDAAARTWVGPTRFHPTDVTEWINGGACLVGGCCRVGPPEIRAIRDLVRAERVPFDRLRAHDKQAQLRAHDKQAQRT